MRKKHDPKKTRPAPKPVPAPKTNKKGLRVLTDKHDLYEIFGEERPPRPDDFGRIFEESFRDKKQRELLLEKKKISDAAAPLTVAQRLKTYPPPQRELDLHGFTSAEAVKITADFIQNACLEKIRTVRIIVGKGLHSQGKAILPDVVEKEIIRLKREKRLLDFDWEKKDKRKSGSLLVYLLF